MSAKISPGPSVLDCPYLLERAQPLNTNQVCHDESRWKRWARWCLCIGVISIDLYGSLILLIPIIWLQFWWFLLYIQCIQKVFTGLQLSCDVTVLFENWLNWFFTWFFRKTKIEKYVWNLWKFWETFCFYIFKWFKVIIHQK